MRSSVDLPEPLGPMSPIRSSRPIRRFRSSTIVFLPKPSDTLSNTTMLTGPRYRRCPRACTRPERAYTHAAMTTLDPDTLERLRRQIPLRLDRRGQFFFEDDPVSHPGVRALFLRGLDCTPAGEPAL